MQKIKGDRHSSDHRNMDEQHNRYKSNHKQAKRQKRNYTRKEEDKYYEVSDTQYEGGVEISEEIDDLNHEKSTPLDCKLLF